MTSSRLISSEFLTWCELLLLWSAASYGVTADPLNGENAKFPWKFWKWSLAFRAGLVGAMSYAMARSALYSSLLVAITLVQPLVRHRLRLRWVAEFECLWIFVFLAASLRIVRCLNLSSRWVPSSLTAAQTAALCIVATTLLLVVRGGTYVVRGILKKASTSSPETQWATAIVGVPGPKTPIPASEPPYPSAPLPPPASSSRSAAPGESSSTLTESNPTPPPEQDAVVHPPETASSSQEGVDVEELNRGRLIGNIERIVLTVVVAAGSYAALAFLVAAKGLVRSEEFEKSRDFTEYFLIGSLSSVLVALCAGLALRFALLALWPELLVLQMQQ